MEVQTDPLAGDTYVWITTFCQALKLSLNESPFFANYGIPGEISVIQQIFPDYYVANMQSLFVQYFSSLIVTKLNNPEPTYRINLTTNQGVPMALNIPV